MTSVTPSFQGENFKRENVSKFLLFSSFCRSTSQEIQRHKQSKACLKASERKQRETKAALASDDPFAGVDVEPDTTSMVTTTTTMTASEAVFESLKTETSEANAAIMEDANGHDQIGDGGVVNSLDPIEAAMLKNGIDTTTANDFSENMMTNGEPAVVYENAEDDYIPQGDANHMTPASDVDVVTENQYMVTIQDQQLDSPNPANANTNAENHDNTSENVIVQPVEVTEASQLSAIGMDFSA